MFKEKLFKKLSAALEEFKFIEPTPFQRMALSTVNSGVDVIGIAPDGAGKSTLIAIAAIQKLQRPIEDAPKVMIIVGNKEKGQAMEEQFNLFGKDTGLRVNTAYEDGNIDEQSIDIYDGTDILIGTAKRVLDIYFSRSLNIKMIKLFVIDDPEMIIKNSWQGQIDRLALSLPKCQHLIFTNEMTEKSEKLISKFIVAPKVIEID
jgi:ATP-dependent RNA helicase RhlE